MTAEKKPFLSATMKAKLYKDVEESCVKDTLTVMDSYLAFAWNARQIIGTGDCMSVY